MTATASTTGRPAPWRMRLADLRTALAGVDPGLARLRLASIAVASVALAAGLTALGRATLAPTEPVTVVLFAGALAMISNLAVNEPTLARRRVTTLLMVLPAAASTIAGTLLSPYRVVADVVFVAVMVTAVYVRRFGPRGFALGMGAFMPFFFTQFLQAKPAQVPWLLVAVGLGIGSTLLLRGVVFAERPERTLRRLVTAFRARSHSLLDVVDDVLAALGPEARDPVEEHDLERLRRARARLNEVALLVEDQLEQTTAGRSWPGLDNDVLALRVFDAELALERLAVAVRRLAASVTAGAPDDGTPGNGTQSNGTQSNGTADTRIADTGSFGRTAGARADADTAAQRPTAQEVHALRAALDRLLVAQSSGTRHREILDATADARGAVAGLVSDTRPGRERVQRVAFSVRRVADAIAHAQRDAPAFVPEAPATPGEAAHPHGPEAARLDHDDMDRRAHDDDTDDDRTDNDDDERPAGGLLLTTRQAVQVGVGTSLAIIGGELLDPQRWYWAVIAAFVVFANTQSRGDLLSRGWGRIVGTVGGVAAGMGLAAVVQGQQVLSLVLLFACVFLALYLVRVSPGLLAFWITAVLALVYGLIGQFSVQTLVLRIEETVIGVVASILAAFLVLPKGTRAAFGDAVEEVVDRVDEVLDATADALVGLGRGTRPVDRTRDMDEALATLRQRVRPLTRPAWTGTRRRGRGSYQRGLRVLVGVDHYVRALARLADSVTDPSWATTLRPAVDRVRDNLDGLRDVLVRGRRRSDGRQVRARSAEPLVDAAEEHAARVDDPHRRADMLNGARLLRRIDQAVVALAVDLGAAERTETLQDPSNDSSAGLANTRSGS